MQRDLRADVVTLDAADDVWTLAFARTESGVPAEYLILQRAENAESDEGIYVEVGDQIYSGYGLVVSEDVSDGQIDLQFSTSVGEPPASFVRIRFEASDENQQRLIRGVDKILFDVVRNGAA